MEDIEKRLEAVENGIKKLSETDLLLAKQIVGSVAPMLLNIGGRTLTGEEAEQFKKVFGQKRVALEEELKGTKTLDEVFSVLYKLDEEVGDFIRATKVDTADKAMDIAHSFIKKYTPVALPLKAERQDDIWLVDIDVGPLAVKIAKVKVDARTGDILSYDIPPK